MEDSEDDAALNLRALRKAGYEPVSERVETREAMVEALRHGAWDVILCDYSLPTFDAPGALEVMQEIGSDVPLIIVSGTVGEETAITAMRSGAHDYLLKGKLLRLGAAVDRELRSAEIRRVKRAAEEALRQSEVRHRLLVEHSFDSIFITDAEGVVRYASPPVERLLGRTPESLVGTGRTEWVVPEDLPIVEHLLEEARMSGNAIGQLRVRHRDGSIRHVECNVRNRLDHPAIGGLIVTAHDLTHRRQMEEERRGRIHAELASKTKSAFLANMSHELRTPLNAIIGFSELMEQGIAGPLTDKQQTYVSNVVQAGRHLLALVNDILDLSKIEAGKLTIAREWVAPGALAESVEHVLRPLAAAQGVDLSVAFPRDLPPLYVDPRRMTQILLNLGSNAIKFTPRGGAVRLGARTRGEAVELSVVDSGIGIRSEDMPKLFREFEQLDVELAKGKERPAGTGLGLALTKRLVEMHGASIDVTSTFGKGTTFTVTFEAPGAISQLSEG